MVIGMPLLGDIIINWTLDLIEKTDVAQKRVQKKQEEVSK